MTLFELLNALEHANIKNIPVVISDGNHQFQILRVTLQQDQNSTAPRSVISITFDTNS